MHAEGHARAPSSNRANPTNLDSPDEIIKETERRSFSSRSEAPARELEVAATLRQATRTLASHRSILASGRLIFTWLRVQFRATHTLDRILARLSNETRGGRRKNRARREERREESGRPFEGANYRVLIRRTIRRGGKGADPLANCELPTNKRGRRV